MSQQTITTTPAKLPGRWSDIQNLSGSVDIWFDTTDEVSPSTGMKLPAGQSYARGTIGTALWFRTTSGSADLRYIA